MIGRFLLVVMSLLTIVAPANAWHDRTHMAVVEAAGTPTLAYLAVGADMAKEKAPNENYNHYSNNSTRTIVTAKLVIDQAARYNTVEPVGHLYGAIIAALDSYQEKKKDPTKYALYPLGYAMHYLGDLSMPFHNMENNDFNIANHSRNDGVVDSEPQLVAEIRARMGKYRIKIDSTNFRESLAAQVALIASRSTALGYQLQAEVTPVMVKDTAYEQLAQSAALLRAVLIALNVPVTP